MSEVTPFQQASWSVLAWWLSFEIVWIMVWVMKEPASNWFTFLRSKD